MIGDNMTKITPETYEKMNEEFIESDEAFRIVVPTQESIDKWQERSGVYHNYDYPKPDLVAEHWKRYNEAKGQEQRTQLPHRTQSPCNGAPCDLSLVEGPEWAEPQPAPQRIYTSEPL